MSGNQLKTRAKHVLFIHSAGIQSKDRGSGPLLTYLEKELQDEYIINGPSMPDCERPDCQAWMDAVDSEIHRRDMPLILIGHSLGGSVLLKYLFERKVEVPVHALFLLAAPFWGADDWKSEEYELGADFPRFLPNIPVHLYHSRDDKIVPFSHLHFYYQKLPNAEIHAPDGYGHGFQQGISILIEDIRKY